MKNKSMEARRRAFTFLCRLAPLVVYLHIRLFGDHSQALPSPDFKIDDKSINFASYYFFSFEIFSSSLPLTLKLAALAAPQTPTESPPKVATLKSTSFGRMRQP